MSCDEAEFFILMTVEKHLHFKVWTCHKQDILYFASPKEIWEIETSPILSKYKIIFSVGYRMNVTLR